MSRRICYDAGNRRGWPVAARRHAAGPALTVEREVVTIAVVSDALALEVEEISEVYSTSGHYDLIAKFYLSDDSDIGHFVTERLQVLEGVADTFTLAAFKAFG